MHTRERFEKKELLALKFKECVRKTIFSGGSYFSNVLRIFLKQRETQRDYMHI